MLAATLPLHTRKHSSAKYLFPTLHNALKTTFFDLQQWIGQGVSMCSDYVRISLNAPFKRTVKELQVLRMYWQIGTCWMSTRAVLKTKQPSEWIFHRKPGPLTIIAEKKAEGKKKFQTFTKHANSKADFAAVFKRFLSFLKILFLSAQLKLSTTNCLSTCKCFKLTTHRYFSRAMPFVLP